MLGRKRLRPARRWPKRRIPIHPSRRRGPVFRGDRDLSRKRSHLRCNSNGRGLLGAGLLWRARRRRRRESHDARPCRRIGPGVKGIATGSAHSCAITASNGVRCWGANDFGQLGDGTIDKQLTPVGVSGLGSGVSAIAAGGVHTCALTATGAVKCWGRTTIGQPIEPTPIDVPGLGSGVVAIAVGGDHACAVTATGNASCWGLNKYGELGDGTLNSTTVPVTVVGMGAGVRAIAAGGDDGGSHTCALTVAGGVKCWGYGLLGQVGDGTFAERHTPVDVIGLASGATAIATGRFHSCAVTVGGGIECWGSNLSAQIGDNSKTLRLVPTASSLDAGVTAIAAGHWHTCAVTASGGARCWGEGTFGQIGDSASITRLVPTDVAGLGSGIAGVTASEHGCAKTLAGGAKCWGSKLRTGGRRHVRTSPGAGRRRRSCTGGAGDHRRSLARMRDPHRRPTRNAGAAADPVNWASCHQATGSAAGGRSRPFVGSRRNHSG